MRTGTKSTDKRLAPLIFAWTVTEATDCLVQVVEGIGKVTLTLKLPEAGMITETYLLAGFSLSKGKDMETYPVVPAYWVRFNGILTINVRFWPG